jgi:hypothetical protein
MATFFIVCPERGEKRILALKPFARQHLSPPDDYTCILIIVVERKIRTPE